MNKKKFTSIGLRMQHFREAVNLKPKDVVLYLKNYDINISVSCIYKWENDNSIPSIEIFIILAYLYNVNIDAFFHEVGSQYHLQEEEIEFINNLKNNKKLKHILSLIAKTKNEVIANG